MTGNSPFGAFGIEKVMLFVKECKVDDMMKKIKKWFEDTFLIKIKKVEDSSCFEEISNLIGCSYQTAMEKDHFVFTHYSDFVENLELVLNEGGQIFIVKYGRKIVGTISMTKKELNKWYFQGEAVKISLFAILPQYQCLGLGKRLLLKAIAYAEEQKVPLFLNTPERNINVIKYYEKYGFYKVKMFLSEEHYTVSLFRPLEEDASFVKRQKKRYRKAVLLCLMKNWSVCKQQSDKNIQKRWEKYYFPYLECENEDVRKDMRKAYRKFEISPKQYKRLKFETLSEEERKAILKEELV